MTAAPEVLEVDELDMGDGIHGQIQTGLTLVANQVSMLPCNGPPTTRDLDELVFLHDALGYFVQDAERRIEAVMLARRAEG